MVVEKEQRLNHPSSPGVYIMRDGNGQVLYVGKAKSLKKRLASYFRPSFALSVKTRALMELVVSIDTLCTTTEKEALLLESTMIKEHKPRFNITLKDDKSFVLFRLDVQANFPTLTVVRRPIADHAKYYGPFTSAQAARDTLKLIRRVFPLRTCRDTVFRLRKRPCLQHHMGRCLAPCVLSVDPAEYRQLVEAVGLLLSGQAGELLRRLKREMWQASQELAFERAGRLRDQIAAVAKTLEAQAVVFNRRTNMDVIGTAIHRESVAVAVLFVREGRLTGQAVFETEGLLGTDDNDHLAGLLLQFYQLKGVMPEVLVAEAGTDLTPLAQVLGELKQGPVQFSFARGRIQRDLLNMAQHNAEEFLLSRKIKGQMSLAHVLNLPAEPRRVEAVDISHLAGQNGYAGQVVFMDGEPLKDAYRLYGLKESAGSRDDVRAMAEWARRRLDQGEPWPDLVLLDGGKAQLSAVSATLKEAGQEGRFVLAAMAKAGRSKGDLFDQVFVPGSKNPLSLKPASPELLFLQRVRDEAHRFVISAQRRSRKKSVTRSSLERLPGIGPKTAKLLLGRFGSLDALKQTTAEGIASVRGVGTKRAQDIFKKIHQ